MYLKFGHIVKQKSWRRQGVGMLCCLLGLIWVVNPSFHSLCHFVDLPHQHPDGSAFKHGHGHSHGHEHGHSHGHEHDHDLATSALVATESSTGRAVDHDPEAPHREPNDSDGPCFFMQLLETETCCSVHNSLFLNRPTPALGESSFAKTGFFSSVELGTIGARGPPTSLVSRYLQWV